MKEYNRELKQWVEKEAAGSLKKRELCKGGREHDWVLCLPPYVTTRDSVLGLDKVEEFYRIEDEREDVNITLDERLEAIGVVSGRCHGMGRRRYHICSVCLKVSSKKE